MSIKLARDKSQREYLTIKINGGFTATELATFVLVDQGDYDDNSVDEILNIKSYSTITKKVKDCILSYGLESPHYSFTDSYTGELRTADECVSLVANHIVSLSKNKLTLE